MVKILKNGKKKGRTIDESIKKTREKRGTVICALNKAMKEALNGESEKDWFVIKPEGNCENES